MGRQCMAFYVLYYFLHITYIVYYNTLLLVGPVKLSMRSVCLSLLLLALQCRREIESSSRRSKQTNKQTNKQTDKQTGKQTNNTSSIFCKKRHRRATAAAAAAPLRSILKMQGYLFTLPVLSYLGS